MNWLVLLQTVLFCLISIIIEAASASKQGKVWFEKLHQPKYSLPFGVWYLIGALYYIICGAIAYRLFEHKESGHFIVTIILLFLMMLGNGLPNFFLFKQRSLSKFMLCGIPFGIIISALYIQLLNTDIISSWILLPYLVWIVYDVYYFYNLRKLNKNSR